MGRVLGSLKNPKALLLFNYHTEGSGSIIQRQSRKPLVERRSRHDRGSSFLPLFMFQLAAGMECFTSPSFWPSAKLSGFRYFKCFDSSSVLHIFFCLDIDSIDSMNIVLQQEWLLSSRILDYSLGWTRVTSWPRRRRFLAPVTVKG